MARRPNNPRMADPAGSTKPTVRQRVKDGLWATTPGWSRKLLVFAFFAMVAGLVLPLFFNKPAEPAPATPSGTTTSSVSGLTSGGTPAPASPAGQPATASSIPGTSTAFALGLSFFAGFIVAWIIRLFFKIGLMIAALAVAVFVALKYFGIDTPDLTGYADQAKELGRQATKRAGDAMAFVKTVVPSGMAAAAGLFVGWRRR